jgi:hypothetical protein
MRRLSVVFVAIVVLAGSLTAAPTTLARFTRARASDATFSTGSIQPPTGLSASVSSGTVTLTWTPTTSTVVTGYTVRRSTTSGSGYSAIGSVTPRGATTFTDTPGTGTFYYVLRSVFQNWDSVNSNEATAVVAGTPVSTGYKNCTSQQFDTGGDGNGYEVTPGNACGVDGNTARDMNTGTTSSLNCTDPGQDRHRFWGYAFGMPGSISSVQGIQVQPTVRVNNNGGSSSVCVQLSWDGGASWTTPVQQNVTNSLTTYTLGGASNTWGHTWTLAQLNTSNFRVRVIDVSSMNGKDFFLDGVTVQVTYTP